MQDPAITTHLMQDLMQDSAITTHLMQDPMQDPANHNAPGAGSHAGSRISQRAQTICITDKTERGFS
jgi:hypothetical protein